MASIAYVSDQHMIEFHRLNGNKRMNFWRPSSSIRFTNFQSGDLLFFLVKGTEKHKEKGITGYGRFQHSERLTPRQAWNKYTTANGYNNREEFFEAITKVNKQKTLPKMIGCLFLQDVVFFQAPIYLSEIDVHISKRIESFVYLDRESESVTIRILEQAKTVGFDTWSTSIKKQDNQEHFFAYDQVREIIKNASETIGNGHWNEKQIRKVFRMAKHAIENMDTQDIDLEFIKGSKTELLCFIGTTIHIYTPLYFFTKDFMQGLTFLLGRLYLYQSLIANNDVLPLKVEMHVFTNQELNPLIASVCQFHHISILSLPKVEKEILAIIPASSQS